MTGVDASRLYHAEDVPIIDTRSTATLAMASASGDAPKMTAGGTDDAVDGAGSIQISDSAGTVPPTENRSVWQTDSVALRVLLSVTWQALPGSTCYVSSVAWGG